MKYIFKDIMVTNRADDEKLKELKEFVKDYEEYVNKEFLVKRKVDRVEAWLVSVVAFLLVCFLCLSIGYGIKQNAEMFATYMNRFFYAVVAGVVLYGVANLITLFAKSKSVRDVLYCYFCKKNGIVLRDEQDAEKYRRYKERIEAEEFFSKYEDPSVWECLNKEISLPDKDKVVFVGKYAEIESGDVRAKKYSVYEVSVNGNRNLQIPVYDLETNILVLPFDVNGNVVSINDKDKDE